MTNTTVADCKVEERTLDREIKFGVGLPMSYSTASNNNRFHEITSFALEAEKVGFDLVTTADHVFIPYEALSALTAIAFTTKRISIGTSVLDLNRRSPAVLAHVTATLDLISNGRLMLGVGVGGGGGNRETWGSTIEKPVSRTVEVISALKKFWTEEKVDYAGSYFRFKNANVAVKPTQKPHPPIWVAGFGPRMLKVTGELGDGFVTQNVSPELFERDFTKVKENARKRGKDPDRIAGIFAAPMAVASDYEKALRCVEGSAWGGFYGIRGALYRHGGPPSHWAKFFGYDKPWESPAEVPMEIVDKSCIFGTLDDCIGKIERYARKGVDYFVALPLHPSGFEGLKVFSKVIGYFRN